MEHLEELLQTQKVKGNTKEYTLSPLTVRDLGLREEWAQSQRIKHIIADLGISDEAERIHIARSLRRAPTTADELIALDAELSSELTSYDGMLYEIWLSVKHKNPNCTVDELYEELDSALVIEALLAVRELTSPGSISTDESKNKKAPKVK